MAENLSFNFIILKKIRIFAPLQHRRSAKNAANTVFTQTIQCSVLVQFVAEQGWHNF